MFIATARDIRVLVQDQDDLVAFAAVGEVSVVAE
jgi:hypothetical protein